jgi:hypothetical protein
MLVLSQLTSTMLLTRRQVMHLAIKVTKLALVATCTVAQALLIRATLDIKVDQVTQVADSFRLCSKVAASPLTKVATHLLITRVAASPLTKVATHLLITRVAVSPLTKVVTHLLITKVAASPLTKVTTHLLIAKVAVSPLTKVVTHLLTKVAILTMEAQQATKASQATQAIKAQVHHLMRGGTDMGGITNRILLRKY